MSLYFIDENNGWIAGDEGILMTIDGGNNWNFPASGQSSYLYSVRFVNDSVGWAVGKH
jgi:photosystem II stability/assembly factor-like uncharacterized protein